MTCFYSDPNRESDPFALPDAEAFYATDCFGLDDDSDRDDAAPAGWYVWACFPGCMPDSDPCGPYDSEAEAIAAWRDESGRVD